MKFLTVYRISTLALLIGLSYAGARLDNTSDILSHPAWKIIDKFECGESVADRIIGGRNAALGQFPWIVRLGYSVEGVTDFMCGGALVTDRHVITAAHCVTINDYGVELTFVRMGEYNANTNPDCVMKVCAPKVQDRWVKKITHHELYQKPPFHNDIAMIELQDPVILHEYVTPVCLPRSREERARPNLGEFITLAGWGKTNMTTSARADILQYITLPILQPQLCNHFGAQFSIMSSEICAGAQINQDTCNGDSGGPATKVFDTPDGPKNVIIGIVSFGPTRCGIKKPAVYTFTPHFLKWILDHILM